MIGFNIKRVLTIHVHITILMKYFERNDIFIICELATDRISFLLNLLL